MNNSDQNDLIGISSISAASWNHSIEILKHTFLVRNLKKSVPHPFLRRNDLELIICSYVAGDHGEPHWHLEVDEFEFVIDGAVIYEESQTGEIHHFIKNDLIHIPMGVCVKRIVTSTCKTLTVKIPSKLDKVICSACSRICTKRISPFL